MRKKRQNGNGMGVLLAYLSGIATLVSGIWKKKWWLGNGIGNTPSGPSINNALSDETSRFGKIRAPEGLFIIFFI